MGPAAPMCSMKRVNIKDLWYQLAVLLFAGDRAQNPVLVFLAASTALVVATGIAVLIGSQGARDLEMVPLKPIAGLGFIAIGAWSLLEHFRG